MPELIPVTTPDALTLATYGSLLLHVPPDEASVQVDVVPGQKDVNV